MMSTNTRILFAHTNPTFLMYVGILLKRLGYPVSLARDGVEVVSQAKEHLPAVVVLEYGMPKMNGLSCLSMIRNDVDMRDLPVLVVDSGLDDALRAEFRKLRVSGFLALPLNITEFYRSLQECFRHSIKRRHVRADLRLPVSVQSGDEQFDLYASNLSAEGMYIRTLRPLEAGKKLLLVFSVDEDDPIEVEGDVVSTHLLGGDFSREPGMGIRFLEIAEDARYRLYYFLMKELTKDFDEEGQLPSAFDDSLL